MNNNNGIRKQKIKRVTEYLQNALFPLAVGEKMPGIRSIMKDTGTGRKAVGHALDTLVAQGMIRVDPYRGIFRTKPAEKSDEIRLLHWSLNSLEQNSFAGLLFESLLKEAAHENRKLTIENVKNRSQEEICDELIKHGIANCIVCGAINPNFAKFMKQKMNVCMELLPRHTADNVTCLRDAPDMTILQINYLLNLGYSRIGYIHFCGNDISLYPVQVMRLMDYYRLMAENHLYVNPDWVFHCTDWYENLEEGLKKIISAQPMPQALIVPGSALEYLYPLCKKYGIRIGKDLAVFSCDETDGKFIPKVTEITNDPKSIAQKCWQMFSALSRKEKVESCHTELRIRTGNTVPSLKK